MTGSVVHFEVPYDDADRARGFYRDVFGWAIEPIPELDYNMVSTGEVGEDGMPTGPGYIGGGMFQRTAQMDRPVITIDVDDINAALAAIEDAGGTRMGDPNAVGEMGWAGYFTDPEGNLMGLWQSARQG